MRVDLIIYAAGFLLTGFLMYLVFRGADVDVLDSPPGIFATAFMWVFISVFWPITLLPTLVALGIKYALKRKERTND